MVQFNKYFSTIFHSKLPLNIYFYNKWKDTTSVGVEISQVYNRVKYVTRCQEKKKKRQLRAIVPQLSYVQQCYSVPSGLITWSHKASVIALIVFYQFIYFNHFFVFKYIYIYFIKLSDKGMTISCNILFSPCRHIWTFC